MREESDPTPAPSTPALCQTIPWHCGQSREEGEEEPRRPKDRATAGLNPILSLPEALLSLTHKVSSEWGAWPWKDTLAQIPASITARSTAAVPARQLHPERTRPGRSHKGRVAGEAWCLAQQQDQGVVHQLAASDAPWQLAGAYGTHPPAQGCYCKSLGPFVGEWQLGELTAEGMR